uniref:Uncharacterized protein n=1 Tax=Rhizophora mucronata TaxID=61149 RepID=A0A2P2QWT2_RHIMU
MYPTCIEILSHFFPLPLSLNCFGLYASFTFPTWTTLTSSWIRIKICRFLWSEKDIKVHSMGSTISH